MSDYDIALHSLVLEYTLKIKEVHGKSISLEDFLSGYSNFYYMAALDGHEAELSNQPHPAAIFPETVELHRLVQEELLDRIFQGTGEIPSGRISMDEAIDIIRGEKVRGMLSKAFCELKTIA